jgi:alanine racemase
MFRPTVAEVHLDRLRRNYKTLTSSVRPDQFLCAMVKADAYGHGDVAVSRCLESVGCQTFGVALVEEGIRLRQGGIKGTVLVFGVFDTSAFHACLEHRLQPVISSLDDLKLWNECVKSSQSSPRGEFHLEIDTGMNRLGVLPAHIGQVHDLLAASPHLRAATVFTHFSHGEDFGESGGECERQLAEFQKSLQPLAGLGVKHHHVFASSSFLGRVREEQASNHMWSEGLRLGISLHGVLPDMNRPGTLVLEPTMKWRTKVAAIHPISKGQRVSYGGTWQASRDSVIATLPVGYADGYPRALSNKSSVLIRGQRVRLVGNVCMDYVMADVTEIPGLDRGEEVVLWGWQNGSELTVNELAKQLATIPYTLLTGVSARVPREYVE